MTRTRRAAALVGFGAFAAIVAAVALATPSTPLGSHTMPRGGHGMMQAPGGAMMGAFGRAGPASTVRPTAAQFSSLRSRVDAWLAGRGFAGFKVAEVMAFSNNDYVAVHDAAGMPAFELLTNSKTTWVMEEPPSMMWNTRYGMGSLSRRVIPMMGGWMTGGSWNAWYGAGSGKVASTTRAVEVANRWLAEASPGEQVASDAGGGAMGHFPGYYSFDTTRDGSTAGMLSVNASTGAVWYHAWHGRFLGEQEF
jgi:hypothetical protein